MRQKKNFYYKLILFSPLIFIASISFAQVDTVLQKEVASPAKKLAVFIDCNTACDINYIKTNFRIVDFLLDMNAADAHVLINEQATGGGGGSIQMIFYGRHAFKSIRDTLTLNIMRNTTDFERRAEMLRVIKVGLVPFLAKTSYAKFIDIKINLGDRDSINPIIETKDAWNYWVFGIGADGTLNTDEVYESKQLRGYVSANRTTDKLKLGFRASGNNNNYNYHYTDNGRNIEIEVLNTDYLFEHSLIMSLGKHWGIGYLASYSNSTFSNNKRRIYGTTAIEYSIFPYKDVNTRFFTSSYGIDVRANRYYDTTIYFKTSEILYGQVAEAKLSFQQKWGTFSSRVTFSNYLKNTSLNNLSANLDFNIRVTGGLSFNFYVSGAKVNDQVYLVKGSASPQDVLTRRRQLASAYNFYSGAGLYFRFGSKLNNFVNPRLKNL
ncbi:MAG: hypothetical protein ABIO81_13835 [Ginsengibacter sp.]